MNLIEIITTALAILCLYFVSSGVAFILMYKMGERFPNQLIGKLYSPLERLGHRSKLFLDFYNGFQACCYRLFVGELVNGWVPPPPTISREIDEVKNDTNDA